MSGNSDFKLRPAICVIALGLMVSACGGSCDLAELPGRYVYESTAGMTYELNLDAVGAGDIVIEGATVESFEPYSEAANGQIFIKASLKTVDQLWAETGFSNEGRPQAQSLKSYLGFRPQCPVFSTTPYAVSIGPESSVVFLRQN
jgi:hypothetical protein